MHDIIGKFYVKKNLTVLQYTFLFKIDILIKFFVIWIYHIRKTQSVVAVLTTTFLLHATIPSYDSCKVSLYPYIWLKLFLIGINFYILYSSNYLLNLIHRSIKPTSWWIKPHSSGYFNFLKEYKSEQLLNIKRGFSAFVQV